VTRRAFALVFVFVTAAASGCDRGSSGSSGAAPASAVAASSAAGVTTPARLEFLERTTAGASASESLPMIVAIHGLGDKPESWLSQWDTFPVKARIILPRGPDPWGSGSSWFHYPPRSVEELATGVRASSDRVAALLAELSRSRPTKGKPIVTGFSQGGFLTFALAIEHREVVGYAVPMSGGFPIPLWPAAPAPADAPPIFAVHGTADVIVRIDPTRDAVKRLAELGYKIELKEYPGIPHTVARPMHIDVEARLAKAATDAAAL
jgi:phospholipase/carboxylesterase